MYVRTLNFNLKPEAWEQAVAAIREQSIPLLEKQPGLHRMIVAGDRESGQGFVITFWETAAEAERYLESTQVLHMMRLFLDMATAPPDIHGYPVVIDHDF